ncbi:MAG: HlyC/CorC family transporter [Coriobacteriia bacterium]|nr:HlyC/CorC family transporter [Coriobacteriia bacterium]
MIIIALVVLFLVGCQLAVVVACETSILMLSPGRAYRLAESQTVGANNVEQLIEGRHRMRAMAIFLSALSSGLIAAATFYLTLTETSFSGWAAVVVSFLATVISMMVYFALFQATPRAFAVTNPEYIALKTAGFTLGLTNLYRPIVSVLSAPAKGVVTAAGGERKVTIWAVTPEWRDEQSGEQTVEEEQEAFLETLNGFSDKIAREVMTPRTDIHSLEDTATISDAVDMVEDSGCSRIPIYHDDLDDIRGILYSKDLLRVVANHAMKGSKFDQRTLLELSRPAVFIPETKPLPDLMIEMRTHTHMVIVADEYGGTSGLLSLEDLLEEIVGDISDEFDSELPELTKLGEDVYLMSGSLSVDELNDLYDTAFDLDADSVAGLFTELIGRIPNVGESVEAEGLKLVVTRLDGNRIVQLRVCPAQKRGAE